MSNQSSVGFEVAESSFRLHSSLSKFFSLGLENEGLRLLQAVFIVCCFLPLLNGAYCWLRSEPQKGTDKGQPPSLPQHIPVLGNVTFLVKLFINPAGTLSEAAKFLGSSTPIRIRLLPPKYDIYIVTGAKNLSTLFRNSKHLSWTAEVIHGAKYCFGFPQRDIEIYLADDSGVSHIPHPESNVDSTYRMWHFVHRTTAEFLGGAGLAPLVERYTENLKNEVSDCQINHQWTYKSDLNWFIREVVFRASINATFGSHMLFLNPTFVEDFWEFDKCFPHLLKGPPRWLAPRSWRSREKCHQAIGKWHAFVDENHGKYDIDDASQADPIFGSKYMRVRHKNLTAMDRMSKEHINCSDLGFVWAEHANSISSIFWVFFHACRDAHLMARLRREVETCRIVSASGLAFDIQKLQKQPILGAVWAEVLRLYVATAMSRTPDRADFKLGEWIIPKGKSMILSAYEAHRDETAFNMYMGSVEDYHPLDEFWVERFLVTKEEHEESGPELKFNGLDGAYIPFGGGISICPGRHYAKQTMLTTFAFLVTAFEIELCTAEGTEVKAGMSHYGTGVLRPLSEVPFRVRRRAQDWQ